MTAHVSYKVTRNIKANIKLITGTKAFSSKPHNIHRQKIQNKYNKPQKNKKSKNRNISQLTQEQKDSGMRGKSGVL